MIASKLYVYVQKRGTYPNIYFLTTLLAVSSTPCACELAPCGLFDAIAIETMDNILAG